MGNVIILFGLTMNRGHLKALRNILLRFVNADLKMIRIVISAQHQTNAVLRLLFSTGMWNGNPISRQPLTCSYLSLVKRKMNFKQNIWKCSWLHSLYNKH